jgi:hypothetical protein
MKRSATWVAIGFWQACQRRYSTISPVPFNAQAFGVLSRLFLSFDPFFLFVVAPGLFPGVTFERFNSALTCGLHGGEPFLQIVVRLR